MRFEIEAEELKKLSTKDLKKTSLGIGSFRRGASVFFDEDSLNKSSEEDIAILQELIEDETLPRLAIKEVENKYNFKTPLNVVFTHSKPERKFVEKLITHSNSIDAWIKSRDTGFYSIEYSWRKGEHPKQNYFNPDFFIKVGNKIIVVEIKDDGIISKIKDSEELQFEMKAIYSFTIRHFERVNKLISRKLYYFTFLTPSEYDNFFAILRKKPFKGFKSNLDSLLADE